MDRKIFLVRHGHIEYEGEKRYIGITDLPLSPAGIEQVTGLKEYFSGIEIEKAFTSPLKRCLRTAEILLEGRNTDCEVVDELKEIHMGEWENKSMALIRQDFPELYEKRGATIDTFIPPGGESFEQLQKRVMPVFESIARSAAGNILIVGHAGVNRVILSTLMGVPLKELFQINQPYGCINRLIWDMTSGQWHWCI